MLIDLFRRPELAESDVPTSMTALPDASVVLRHTEHLSLRIGESETTWRVPDPFGFLSMKVRAKLEQRSEKAKDCFDIYVFVRLLGLTAVSASLDRAPERASTLRTQLKQLFWNVDSAGVEDVLREAGLTDEHERALLARDAVDLFAELVG